MTNPIVTEAMIARQIYANLHHLMRVTGTEAQTAYESAARSILAMTQAAGPRAGEVREVVRELRDFAAELHNKNEANLVQRAADLLDSLGDVKG